VLDADITDRQQAEAAVERAVAELGRLDTVVNNAGVMLNGPVAEAPAGEWDRMLAVNFEGLLHVTRVAIPHLIRAAQDSPKVSGGGPVLQLQGGEEPARRPATGI
jgi:NADP-dependent 3-hydroxy acid dehydrogenase YdfG